MNSTWVLLMYRRHSKMNSTCHMGTSHVPTVKPANHLLYFQRRDVNMKITKVGLPDPIIVHVH